MVTLKPDSKANNIDEVNMMEYGGGAPDKDVLSDLESDRTPRDDAGGTHRNLISHRQDDVAVASTENCQAKARLEDDTVLNDELIKDIEKDQEAAIESRAPGDDNNLVE